ncbi:MAG: hypothetical protein AAGC88_03010 [Bacteroidota bacterium]
MLNRAIIVQCDEVLPQMIDVIRESLQVDAVLSCDKVKEAIQLIKEKSGSTVVLFDINLPVDHECLFFNEIDKLDQYLKDQLKVIITTDRGNAERLKSLPIHETVLGVLPVPFTTDELVTILGLDQES